MACSMLTNAQSWQTGKWHAAVSDPPGPATPAQPLQLVELDGATQLADALAAGARAAT